MIPQKTKCFVIVVHFGEPFITARCIAGLCQSPFAPDMVIIVDHAAVPFVADSSYASRCKVVRSGVNTGYGAGFNEGLRALKTVGIQDSDVVVCMNNDISVGEQMMGQLREWWRQQTKSVLAGPRLMAISLLTGRAQNFLGMMRLPYVDGAFVSARYSVWRSLGGMPADYFLYCEDALLSWRALRANISLQAIPGLAITHAQSVETDSDQKTYYLVRNGARLLSEEAPGLWKNWWRGVNWLRLLWHSTFSRSPKRNIITQALKDAGV
jgi:GT2 family glycosyltransferase